MIDPQTVKKQFPIFDHLVEGKKLIYLDNASTSQKPQVVIDAITKYYETMNSNIHRGVHRLSEIATAAYEGVREQVRVFVNAREGAEVIFTRNTTEAINLVAYSWGEDNIVAGDEIVVTALEHHSNLVPWQELCRRKQAILKVIPITAEGLLDVSELNKFITPKTKLVAITQMSNVLGTITPLKLVIAAAHEVGAVAVVDAAQGIGQLGLNVQDLDADFAAFSAHKIFGPTGVGVLYGKRELLEKMRPFLYGGDMVKEVRPYQASWNDLPWKFEAGTPNIADVIAFGEALKFVQQFGFDKILVHEQKLLKYAREKFGSFEGIRLFGAADVTQFGGILSFDLPFTHAHDIGSVFNDSGVAIRTGHHCAQPLLQRIKSVATARMSFSIFNDESDIDAAVEAMKNVYKIFAP